MWIGPAIATAAGVFLATVRPVALIPSAPVLALWFVSPAVAWWMGRPLTGYRTKLTAEETMFLRKDCAKDVVVL